MVEQTLHLDYIFGALSDTTRRDILTRVTAEEMSIGDISRYYTMTFAAISKHLKVLEKAGLIVKRRQGKQQLVSASVTALVDAERYLNQCAVIMNERFDALEQLMNEESNNV